MKKFIIIIFFSTIFGCHSYNPYKTLSKKEWEAFKKTHPRCGVSYKDYPVNGIYSYLLKPHLYQIIKIDSLQYNYIYYLYDGQKIYKTIGLRDVAHTCDKYIKTIKNCKDTLKLGEKHDFVLEEVDHEDHFVVKKLGFKYEQIIIERDSIIVPNVFQSPQIKGKCYVKINK